MQAETQPEEAWVLCEALARRVFLALCGSPLMARHWRGAVASGAASLASFRVRRHRRGWFRGRPVLRMEYEARAVAVHDLVVCSGLSGHCTVYRAGCRLMEQSTLTFEHTPQGWQAEDGQVY